MIGFVRTLVTATGLSLWTSVSLACMAAGSTPNDPDRAGNWRTFEQPFSNTQCAFRHAGQQNFHGFAPVVRGDGLFTMFVFKPRLCQGAELRHYLVVDCRNGDVAFMQEDMRKTDFLHARGQAKVQLAEVWLTPLDFLEGDSFLTYRSLISQVEEMGYREIQFDFSRAVDWGGFDPYCGCTELYGDSVRYGRTE